MTANTVTNEVMTLIRAPVRCSSGELWVLVFTSLHLMSLEKVYKAIHNDNTSHIWDQNVCYTNPLSCIKKRFKIISRPSCFGCLVNMTFSLCKVLNGTIDRTNQ